MIMKMPVSSDMRNKSITIAGLFFYLYDSRLPEYWDSRRMVSKRGGLADIVNAYSTRTGIRFKMKSYDGMNFSKIWDNEFRRGYPKDIYELRASWPQEVLADRFIDLRPYLEEVNPYTGKKWLDSFGDEALAAMSISDGGPVHAIVFDFSGPAINFNQDVLTEIGVKLPIRAWAEFENALEKCVSSGYQWPIAMFNHPSRPGIYYFSDAVQDMLLRGLAGEIERLYDRVTAQPSEKGCGVITPAHWLVAFEKKLFRPDLPEYVESLTILKRLSRYFLWYFNRYDSIHTKPFFFSSRPQCLFRVGDFRRVRADMELYECIRDGRRLFPFREGAMLIPEITSETSRFASGPSRGHLSPSLLLAISKKTIQDGTFDHALGFLKFFSTRENHQHFVNWSYTVPGIKGVEPASFVKELDPVFEPIRISYSGFSPRARRLWFRAISAMLEPGGRVEDMISATKRVISLDMNFLEASASMGG